MTLQRREPQDPTGPERPTTVSKELRIGIAFDPRGVSALKRLSNALPEKASVKAFCAWMRSHGHGGEQELKPLYLEFCEVMELMGSVPMSYKKFRRAMRNAGHPPKLADWRKEDGTRYRPQIVNLSENNPDLAGFAAKMAEIRTLTPETKKCAKPAIQSQMSDIKIGKAA
jgi:hypothetical protein